MIAPDRHFPHAIGFAFFEFDDQIDGIEFFMRSWGDRNFRMIETIFNEEPVDVLDGSREEACIEGRARLQQHETPNVFIEKWVLDPEESQKTRDILGDKDYIIQTRWVIYPNG